MVGVSYYKAEVEVANAEAPQLEKVTWYADKGLRTLYFWAAILCVASATTGYDGYDITISRLTLSKKNER